jgi:hypothetical protein
MQNPEVTQAALVERLGSEHSLTLDMEKTNQAITYDEFKITKSHLVD